MSTGDLYPTPTRLALLRDIGRGAVLHFADREVRRYWPDGTYTVVSAQIQAMERAGWARLGGVVTDRDYPVAIRPQLIQLTRDGEAVLAAAVGAQEADEVA